MSQVTITLPDGSSRRVPAGTPVRRHRGRHFAAPREGGAGRHRRRPAGRPRRIRSTRDAAGPHRHRRRAPRRCRCCATARRTCWRRRSPTCFPACSAASARPPTKASSTTSSCRGRSSPEDIEAIEKKMRELAQQDLPYERQLWPREEAKQFFGGRGEPLKVQLIDEKTEGQTRGVLLHDQGPRHVRRLLRRPARAVHRHGSRRSSC